MTLLVIILLSIIGVRLSEKELSDYPGFWTFLAIHFLQGHKRKCESFQYQTNQHCDESHHYKICFVNYIQALTFMHYQ